ncbi:MAG: aminopeptidase [Archangium sp.]|nr:aminopeptidase [Archangium sp.]
MMRALFLLVALLGTSGCFTTGYLLQAAGGQYELVHSARSLKSVVKDPATPPRIKALLVKVPSIKRYGLQRGLKPTENYSDYVDLHRSAAVYVVQGCHPLKFESRRWQFPIVGTVPYLGFFDEKNARRYAEELGKEEHLDVTVRTAGAYSTLGWFRDPVLSTMIPEGADALGELVNVILHESVHATVYVTDQTAFDESFASFVADHLTREYLLTLVGSDAPETKAYFDGEERGARFVAALRIAHEDLTQLYASSLSDDEKLAKKTERYAALQRQLGTRRAYNNADLAGVRTYDSGRAAFERLRVRCHNWWRVIDAVRSLKATDFKEPQQAQFDDVIDSLADRACPLGQ